MASKASSQAKAKDASPTKPKAAAKGSRADSPDKAGKAKDGGAPPKVPAKAKSKASSEDGGAKAKAAVPKKFAPSPPPAPPESGEGGASDDTTPAKTASPKGKASPKRAAAKSPTRKSVSVVVAPEEGAAASPRSANEGGDDSEASPAKAKDGAAAKKAGSKARAGAKAKAKLNTEAGPPPAKAKSKAKAKAKAEGSPPETPRSAFDTSAVLQMVEGVWEISGGEKQETIQGGALLTEDGPSPIAVEGTETISVIREGEKVVGTVSADGSQVEWEDGQTWTRRSEDVEEAALSPRSASDGQTPPVPVISTEGSLEPVAVVDVEELFRGRWAHKDKPEFLESLVDFKVLGPTKISVKVPAPEGEDEEAAAERFAFLIDGELQWEDSETWVRPSCAAWTVKVVNMKRDELMTREVVLQATIDAVKAVFSEMLRIPVTSVDVLVQRHSLTNSASHSSLRSGKSMLVPGTSMQDATSASDLSPLAGTQSPRSLSATNSPDGEGGGDAPAGTAPAGDAPASVPAAAPAPLPAKLGLALLRGAVMGKAKAAAPPPRAPSPPPVIHSVTFVASMFLTATQATDAAPGQAPPSDGTEAPAADGLVGELSEPPAEATASEGEVPPAAAVAAAGAESSSPPIGEVTDVKNPAERAVQLLEADKHVVERELSQKLVAIDGIKECMAGNALTVISRGSDDLTAGSTAVPPIGATAYLEGAEGDEAKEAEDQVSELPKAPEVEKEDDSMKRTASLMDKKPGVSLLDIVRRARTDKLRDTETQLADARFQVDHMTEQLNSEVARRKKLAADSKELEKNLELAQSRMDHAEKLAFQTIRELWEIADQKEEAARKAAEREPEEASHMIAKVLGRAFGPKNAAGILTEVTPEEADKFVTMSRTLWFWTKFTSYVLEVASVRERQAQLPSWVSPAPTPSSPSSSGSVGRHRKRSSRGIGKTWPGNLELLWAAASQDRTRVQLKGAFQIMEAGEMVTVWQWTSLAAQLLRRDDFYNEVSGPFNIFITKSRLAGLADLFKSGAAAALLAKHGERTEDGKPTTVYSEVLCNWVRLVLLLDLAQVSPLLVKTARIRVQHEVEAKRAELPWRWAALAATAMADREMKEHQNDIWVIKRNLGIDRLFDRFRPVAKWLRLMTLLAARKKGRRRRSVSNWARFFAYNFIRLTSTHNIREVTCLVRGARNTNRSEPVPRRFLRLVTRLFSEECMWLAKHNLQLAVGLSRQLASFKKKAATHHEEAMEALADYAAWASERERRWDTEAEDMQEELHKVRGEFVQGRGISELKEEWGSVENWNANQLEILDAMRIDFEYSQNEALLAAAQTQKDLQAALERAAEKEKTADVLADEAAWLRTGARAQADQFEHVLAMQRVAFSELHTHWEQLVTADVALTRADGSPFQASLPPNVEEILARGRAPQQVVQEFEELRAVAVYHASRSDEVVAAHRILFSEMHEQWVMDRAEARMAVEDLTSLQDELQDRYDQLVTQEECTKADLIIAQMHLAHHEQVSAQGQHIINLQRKGLSELSDAVTHGRSVEELDPKVRSFLAQIEEPLEAMEESRAIAKDRHRAAAVGAPSAVGAVTEALLQNSIMKEELQHLRHGLTVLDGARDPALTPEQEVHVLRELEQALLRNGEMRRELEQLREGVTNINDTAEGVQLAADLQQALSLAKERVEALQHGEATEVSLREKAQAELDFSETELQSFRAAGAETNLRLSKVTQELSEEHSKWQAKHDDLAHKAQCTKDELREGAAELQSQKVALAEADKMMSQLREQHAALRETASNSSEAVVHTVKMFKASSMKAVRLAAGRPGEEEQDAVFSKEEVALAPERYNIADVSEADGLEDNRSVVSSPRDLRSPRSPRVATESSQETEIEQLRKLLDEREEELELAVKEASEAMAQSADASRSVVEMRKLLQIRSDRKGQSDDEELARTEDVAGLKVALQEALKQADDEALEAKRANNVAEQELRAAETAERLRATASEELKEERDLRRQQIGSELSEVLDAHLEEGRSAERAKQRMASELEAERAKTAERAKSGRMQMQAAKAFVDQVTAMRAEEDIFEWTKLCFIAWRKEADNSDFAEAMRARNKRFAEYRYKKDTFAMFVLCWVQWHREVEHSRALGQVTELKQQVSTMSQRLATVPALAIEDDTAVAQATIRQLREDLAQAKESVSGEPRTPDHSAAQLRQAQAEMAALREEMQHVDADSAKISRDDLASNLAELKAQLSRLPQSVAREVLASEQHLHAHDDELQQLRGENERLRRRLELMGVVGDSPLLPPLPEDEALGTPRSGLSPRTRAELLSVVTDETAHLSPQAFNSTLRSNMVGTGFSVEPEPERGTPRTGRSPRPASEPEPEGRLPRLIGDEAFSVPIPIAVWQWTRMVTLLSRLHSPDGRRRSSRASQAAENAIRLWARLYLGMMNSRTPSRENGLREAVALLSHRCAELKVEAEEAHHLVKLHSKHALSIQQFMVEDHQRRLAQLSRVGNRDLLQEIIQQQGAGLLEKSRKLLQVSDPVLSQDVLSRRSSMQSMQSVGSAGSMDSASQRSTPRDRRETDKRRHAPWS